MKRLRHSFDNPVRIDTASNVTDLDQSAESVAPHTLAMEWQPVASAPFDRELELAVIDRDGPHALVFPCRRILNGWINARTKAWLEVHPTHWRLWDDKA